jgi:hypothetical protein
MLYRCESCGRHSLQSAYEATTQHELCPACYDDLVKQLAAKDRKKCTHPEYAPTSA